MPMKIALSGLTASGKTTLGEVLAERLGYRHIQITLKALAKEHGMSVVEFEEYAKTHKNIDLEFDAYIKKEAEKQDCVVSAMLSPWMIHPFFSVYLYASFDIRVKRVMKREHLDERGAQEYIKKKDALNFERYRNLYNIDFESSSLLNVFDMALCTNHYTPEQLCDLVLEGLKFKKGDMNGSN